MGIITVNGPQTGNPYAVKIAGQQPTPEEQERINKYVADQEQYAQSVIAGYRGAPMLQQQAPTTEPDVEPEDTTALGRGFRRGLESVQSLFGTSVEELGRGTGIAGLESFGRGLEESAQAELQRLATEEGVTTRQDVEGLGTGLSYVGEIAGEQAPILGTTLAGTGAGALAGSALGPVGAGVGAVVGGAAASFPLLFGGNVQRQEEQVAAGELENVDINKALVAAGGQAAIEGIAGRILAFMPFRPGVGNLFSRTVKTGVAGAATEVPTEITQQIIERAQAGLPIDSDDAIQEYIDAGVAAGILGGGIGTVAGAVRPNLANQELDQDFDEFMRSNAGRLTNVDQHIDEDERDTNAILALPAPEPEPILDALPAPEPEAIFEGKDFGRNEYNTVLQQVQEDGELNMPKAQSRLREVTGTPVPMQRVRSIAELLAERGEIEKSTRAKKDKYTIAPANKAASEAIDTLRKDMEAVTRKIRKISTELPRLDLDRRYAEQTGRDTYGKQRKAAEVERVIQSKLVQLDKLNERLEGNKQKLRTVNVDYSVPLTEKVGMPASQVRMQDLIEENRREQEAELQKVRAAANARAVSDAIRGNRDKNVSITTQEYTKRQGEILDKLRKRLDNIGLKNVKIEGKKVIGSEQEGFAEGASYATPAGEQVIGLSMGLYDPTLSDTDYEARVAEVMNHEVVHALRNLNVFTPKELKLLSRAARKTNYVKAADGKNIKRNYTYFDRAARINPELSTKKDKQGVLSALEEEAVAEMYRDYVSGRLPKVGQSRSVLKRIGDFFKSIVGAHVDSGFNSVDSIFGNITGGSVAARQEMTRQAQEALDMAPRPTPQAAVDPRLQPQPINAPDIQATVQQAAPQAEAGATGASVQQPLAPLIPEAPQAAEQALPPQVKRSRIPVTEEEFRLPQDIRMPIDPTLPFDQVRAQIQRMTNQNRPIVRRLIKDVDAEFGTKSGDNSKDLSKVTQKAQRPSILAAKPWHDVSHIRDSYRFKTVIDDFRKVPGIFNKLLDAGISLVKIDTNKLFEPKEWGWRIIAFDLRMPNGQLVEWYLPLKELEIEKKQRGHLIFEEWRNKTQEELAAQREEYFDAIARSYRGYDNAFKAALERMGLTPQEAEASWRSAESSISEAARNARKSSGVGISSGASAETGLTTPSAVRTALEPSDMKMTAREVPSSTSANDSSDIGVTPSDIDVTGMPLEQQPSFARLRRSNAVPALTDFIRSNPDGFTINSETYEPVSGGFVVAPLKEAEIIVGENLPEEVLLDYLEDNRDIARAIGQPVYLGGWFDSESNQYFLDNTLIVPTAEEALYIAEAAEQLAIFDLNNFEEIRTDAGIRGLQESGAYSGDTAVGYQRRLAEVGRRFAEARNNRNAREKEQLVGRVDQKFSRLTVPLTQEQRDASILDYLDPKTGKPLFNAKPGTQTIVGFANKILGLRNARSYDIINSEEDRQEVARIFAAEAEAALLSSSDALGWYDKTLKLAKQVLSKVYPEVTPTLKNGERNPSYDPNAEIALDFATAITSNGLAVTDNYDFAAHQYDAWKTSKDGKFPVEGKGKQGGSMLAAFEFWNTLVDQGYTPSDINNLLMTEVRRGDLNRMMADVLGLENVSELPKQLQADSKELADEIVSVAYLLGPKIGNGFYRNLRGNFDPITMDRWWMRFMNRITGNPIKEVNPVTLEKNVDTIWQKLTSNDLTSMDREILATARKRMTSGRLKKSDIVDIAPIINQIYEKDYFLAAYKDKLDELKAQGYEVLGKEGANARRIAQAARPDRTPFLKNIGTYVKNLDIELQEDPRSGRDRRAMRDVTERAKQILKVTTGTDITNADIQALMWYAEKRLFAAGGVRKGRGDDNDYADGAIYVLKQKGLNNADIEDTLPDSERGRVRRIASELSANEAADAKVVEIGGPEYGDFFGPRQLVIEQRATSENLTPDELADVEETLSAIEELGTTPPVKFSAIPTRPYAPVRAPVQGGGILDYAYGFIEDGKRKVPVILPEGAHKEIGDVEVGHGLYHIHRRAHDRELVENSKYKRVENAIYDLLRRWQNQGYQDGDSVIGYPSRDGYVLEWRNNLTHSSPPLQLVLEEKPLGNSTVFYVKTFYPILEKAKRISDPHRGKKRAQMVRAYSRIPVYSRTPNAASQFVGPSDLANRAESIRYTKVQDTMAKVISKLPFVRNEDAHAKTTAFMTKLQDSMLPLGQMYDKLRDKYGPGVITQDLDAYFQETLMHGVSGPKKEKFDRTSFKPVLEQVANMKVTDQENGTLEKISGYYKDMLEKYGNRSHALANAYLYAQHAEERNARMKAISKGEREAGSGMSDGEAKSIKAFVAMLPASKRETLQQIDSRVQDMIKQTNQVYIEGGLIPDYMLNEDIDEDTRQKFKQYNSYVPLRGFSDPESDLDTTNEMFLSSTQKYGASGSPDMKALGRSSYAGDILANVAVQHHQAIDKAERNKVGQALLRLLEREDIDTDEFGKVLQQHPMKRVLANGTIRYVPDRNFNQLDEPILSVRRDGKEFLLAMNPAIAKAMKGSLSPKQSNVAVRFAHQITRAYANLLTSYNPAFLLSNWPRDIATALFNAQQYGMKGAEGKIMKGVVPAFRAILNVVNEKGTADPYWANRYQQFYENGGQNVLNQMSDMISASKDIQRTIKGIVEADEKGLKNVVKRGFVGPSKSILGYIEALNTAVENSTRVSFFDAMVTQLESEGVPQKEALKRAAFAARNLTTNFSKGGEWKNGLNSFYLFFNASLQGSMAIFNSLANSSKARKVASGIVVMGFLLDQLNAALSADDDDDGIKDWDNISDYTLSHNLILPDLNGDGSYIKIPMAYGLNTLFDFGRVTSNLIRGTAGYEGTYTPEQAASQLLSVTEEMINPFGGNSFLTFLSPTVGDLPVELLTNEDFRNAPIYKELSPFEQYKSRSGLYWSTTSPSAIWMSKFINDTIGGGDEFIPGTVMGMRVDIQPDVIEHILGFMTGGVGTLARQTADTLTTNLPNAAMGQWESDMIRSTPFVNKFLTAVTDKDRAGDYYEKRDDVFAVRRSFRNAVEARDARQIAALRERYPEIIRIMEPIRKIDNAITKIRTQLKLIKANPNLSRERKLEIEDAVDKRVFELQQRAMQLMRGI